MVLSKVGIDQYRKSKRLAKKRGNLTQNSINPVRHILQFNWLITMFTCGKLPTDRYVESTSSRRLSYKETIEIKGSSRQLIAPRSSKEYFVESVPDSIRELREIVGDKKCRQIFVKQFIAQPSGAELLIQARFLGAVGEFFQETDTKLRLAKGRKIESMFLQSGSMFQLEDIPREFRNVQPNASLKSLEKKLGALKAYVEIEMAKSNEVMMVIRSIDKN